MPLLKNFKAFFVAPKQAEQDVPAPQKSPDDQKIIDALCKRHPGMDRLLWVLDQEEGEFSLYFARCNVPEYRKALSAALIMECEKNIIEIDVHELDFDPKKSALDVSLQQALADAPPHSPVFLYGLERLLPIDEKKLQDRTLQQLNWRRSAYARLKRPLVIWLSDAALSLLAQGAPDFYDWYSGFYEFDVPEEERPHFTQKSLEQAKAGRVHPAYRLNEAGKLKLIHYLQGLLEESTETSEEVLEQLNDLCGLYFYLSDYQALIEYAQQMLVLAKELENKKRMSQAHSNLGLAYSGLNDYEQAQEHQQQTVQLAQEIDNKGLWAQTLSSLATTEQVLGDYEAALEHYQQALAVHQQVGNHQWEAGTLCYMADLYQQQGEYSQALQALKQALPIAQQIQDRNEEAICLRLLGDVHQAQGEYEQALVLYQQALHINKELGGRQGEAVNLSCIGNIHQAQGKYEQALALYQQALQIEQALGRRQGEAVVRQQMASVYLAQNDMDRAWAHLQAAQQTLEALKAPGSLSLTVLVMGDYYQAKGHTDEAQAHWQAAYDLAKPIGFAKTLRELEQRGVK